MDVDLHPCLPVCLPDCRALAHIRVCTRTCARARVRVWQMGRGAVKCKVHANANCVGFRQSTCDCKLCRVSGSSERAGSRDKAIVAAAECARERERQRAREGKGGGGEERESEMRNTERDSDRDRDL